MSLPDYQVTVIDPYSSQVIRIFDTRAFSSLHYSLVLNGIGALVITFDTDEDLTNLFPLDALIDVQRSSPTTGALVREETYFVRLTHRLREANNEQFIVGGLSLNHLLARRVIDPNDDPLVAGGYSTKAGAADTVMREYAMEQMVTASIDRRFADLTVTAVPGTGESVGYRLRYENLLETFQDIAARGNMDFKVYRWEGRKMYLAIAPIGSNKTYTYNYPFTGFVILDPARGNLSNPSLLLDRRKEGNFGYFLGQGPGSQRITLEMEGDGITDSPWNRIEFQDDVRQAERDSPLQLLSEARTKLKDEAARIEFTFDMTGQLPGNSYREDWVVGDKITCQWQEVRVDLRIVGVEFDIDQGGEQMSIQTELI